MFSFSSKGDWEKTDKFLDDLAKGEMYKTLSKYGQMGVDVLEANTPVESGLTAGSWSYKIVKNKGAVRIEWYNNNVAGKTNVAILLQYGHGTGTGGYVQGRDYINPAMKPTFDTIAEKVWAEVKRL